MVIFLLTIAILGVLGYFCSCSKVGTAKYATLDPLNGTITIVEQGIVAAPLTAEGPFPRWSEDLQIQLRDPSMLISVTPQTLVAGPDFSTRYDMVQTGKVTLDRKAKLVIVDVSYKESHGWSRINGKYRIRNLP